MQMAALLREVRAYIREGWGKGTAKNEGERPRDACGRRHKQEEGQNNETKFKLCLGKMAIVCKAILIKKGLSRGKKISQGLNNEKLKK